MLWVGVKIYYMTPVHNLRVSDNFFVFFPVFAAKKRSFAKCFSGWIHSGHGGKRMDPTVPTFCSLRSSCLEKRYFFPSQKVQLGDLLALETMI